MKQLLALLSLFILGCSSGTNETPSETPSNEEAVEIKKKELDNTLRDGDIIFHTSLSSQSMAIQMATDSKYSHVGMIYKKGNDEYVFEAVQPVKLTPLSEWIKRGKDEHFVVKRLKNSKEIINPQAIANMKMIGEKYMGKDYDLKFEWSDDKIYCSELVWKIYKEAFDIEIGTLQKIEDFDLSDEIVQKKVKERYGNNIPMQELVITPDRMFTSDQLETINI